MREKEGHEGGEILSDLLFNRNIIFRNLTKLSGSENHIRNFTHKHPLMVQNSQNFILVPILQQQKKDYLGYCWEQMPCQSPPETFVK